MVGEHKQEQKQEQEQEHRLFRLGCFAVSLFRPADPHIDGPDGTNTTFLVLNLCLLGNFFLSFSSYLISSVGDFYIIFVSCNLSDGDERGGGGV